MRYAGADWLARNLKRELLPFEAKVADILGAAWRGIYHLDENGLRRATWSHDRVSLCVWGELATFDGSELTALAILCADAHVRLAVQPAMRYLRLTFTARERAGTGFWDRHPTIEAAIDSVRKNLADLRPEGER
jgi:hypothetical protein